MRSLEDRRHSIYDKADSYDAVLADLGKVLDAYERILWLYAEGICRCHQDRRVYLMSVELPFFLMQEGLVDLELFVNFLVAEQHRDLQVAA